MRSCPLSKRLCQVAAMVAAGERVADIGTDHGSLPVYLVTQGIAPMAFAGDVNPGPLEKARETIAQYGCGDRVFPVLGNGLQPLSPSQVDTLVLAGMGGELIARILKEAPWCREKKLVLQPMTGADKLRQWLYQAGFVICLEKVVRDSGKLYTVILSRYTGKAQKISTCFSLLGKTGENTGEEALAYRHVQIARVLTKAKGLAASGKRGESEEWFAVAREMEGAGQSGAAVEEIFQAVNQIAPFSLAESWDNSGFLVGERGKMVRRVLVALDVTTPVLEEACQLGADLIITHHPVIFRGVKSLHQEDLAWKLAREGVGAICAHTNLDGAEGGVADCLSKALGLTQVSPCIRGEQAYLGRMGLLPRPMEARDFAQMVKGRLESPGCLCTLSPHPVENVVVVPGAGGEFVLQALEAGAQALVTGEAKHHEFLLAGELGVTLVAAGHYDTERVVLPALKGQLETLLPQVTFLLSHSGRGPVEVI